MESNDELEVLSMRKKKEQAAFLVFQSFSQERNFLHYSNQFSIVHTGKKLPSLFQPLILSLSVFELSSGLVVFFFLFSFFFFLMANVIYFHQ
ncbi:hypothetical protein HanPI659440_Chr08g0289281 [Helianthus annuus]|nr:hypothetical protein HanPI659440_Chr08g0289281 [Helianthus annuus]